MTRQNEQDMVGGAGAQELDDAAFERLFSSLDEVRASEELKSSTLEAIFAELGEEDEEDAGEGAVDETEVRVEVEDRAEDRPSPKLVSNRGVSRSASRRVRPRGWRLRVAAALLVMLIGLGGGASYALPASHVIVSMDDTSFDLGVNVYGATVSASATTDEGKEVLDAAGVRNLNYADALDRLMDGYEARRNEPPASVRVQVNERFGGQGDAISREAERRVERWRGESEGSREVAAGQASPSSPVASEAGEQDVPATRGGEQAAPVVSEPEPGAARPSQPSAPDESGDERGQVEQRQTEAPQADETHQVVERPEEQDVSLADPAPQHGEASPVEAQPNEAEMRYSEPGQPAGVAEPGQGTGQPEGRGLEGEVPRP